MSQEKWTLGRVGYSPTNTVRLGRLALAVESVRRDADPPEIQRREVLARVFKLEVRSTQRSMVCCLKLQLYP